MLLETDFLGQNFCELLLRYCNQLQLTESFEIQPSFIFMMHQGCLGSCKSVHCCCWFTPVTNLPAVTRGKSHFEYPFSLVALSFHTISTKLTYENTCRICPFSGTDSFGRVNFSMLITGKSNFLPSIIVVLHNSTHPQISKQISFCLFLAVCSFLDCLTFLRLQTLFNLTFLLTQKQE